MRRAIFLTMLSFSALTTHAQWQMQDSHTTASLRGIHSLGNGVAWASGTNGTILHTEDGGVHWQLCTTPTGAEGLDFRGIQAFDSKVALVMSSGKGEVSRVYKTVDGCQTWKLVLQNHDVDGFFDALVFEADNWGARKQTVHMGFLLGDPVKGKFAIFETRDSGDTWKAWPNDKRMLPAIALPKDGAFAASNTSLISPGFSEDFAFVTGGADGSRLMLEQQRLLSDSKAEYYFKAVPLPLAKDDGAGAFSIAARYTPFPHYVVDMMIVGGNYKHPESTANNAVFVTQATSPAPVISTPQSPPHGYRSAVVYDRTSRTWITVGPNGTDISTNDGRNWHPLKPSPTDAPDADKNWNALSLPFVVGPQGRIGILRPGALKP